MPRNQTSISISWFVMYRCRESRTTISFSSITFNCKKKKKYPVCLAERLSRNAKAGHRCTTPNTYGTHTCTHTQHICIHVPTRNTYGIHILHPTHMHTYTTPNTYGTQHVLHPTQYGTNARIHACGAKINAYKTHHFVRVGDLQGSS